MLRCGGCATRSVPDLELSAVSATMFPRIISYVLREAMNCNPMGGNGSIFDRIEWDDANLDHATVRVSAAEIEQAIWNARQMFRHRRKHDRVIFRSRTDGGRPLIVISQLGWRRSTPDHGMGGRGAAMSRSTDASGEAQLARKYEDSRDLAGFETEGEPVEVRRAVTISVRFSDQEIALLRAKADQAGMKVTTYIRSAALEHGIPVDKPALLAVLREASEDVARAERLLSAEPKGRRAV
jgi:predicted DNA binding CopG/RHH family protein